MSEATETYLWVVTHPMLWILLGLTALFFVVQWLVSLEMDSPTTPDKRIREFADDLGMGRLHPVLFLILALTWGIVAVTLFVGLYMLLWDIIFHEPPEGKEEVCTWRFALAQLAALTTVLGAVIALPITINRLILTRLQTDTAKEGQITDRINKAVEGLGAIKETNRIGRSVEILEIPPGFEPDDSVDVERLKNPPKRTEIQWQGEPSPVQPTETQGKIGQWEVFTASEPNLEVRIGAIYALERISQDGARDHIQIMEILCAYIRENARTNDLPLPKGEPTPEQWRMWAQEGRQHPRLDVDLKVIERRGADRKRLESDRDYRLGLDRAPFRKIILSERDLTGADLQGA